MSINNRYKIEMTLHNHEKMSKKRVLSLDNSKKDKMQRIRGNQEQIKCPHRYMQTVFAINHTIQERIGTADEGILRTNQEYKVFTDKCLDIFMKKKSCQNQVALQNTMNKQQINSFKVMLNNIKVAYKQQQKRIKYNKSQNKNSQKWPQTSCPKQLIISKTFKQNICHQEDRLQLYRIFRSNQLRNCKFGENQIQIQTQKKRNLKVKQNGLISPLIIISTAVSLGLEAQHWFSISRRDILQSRSRVTTTKNPMRVQHHTCPTQKIMRFDFSNHSENQYSKKLKSFLDFLFKVNYSNNIYVSLELKEELPIFKYKVHIGKGNNSLLIKSLFQRRFWWDIVEKEDNAGVSFYWSQSSLKGVYNKQKRIPITPNPQKQTRLEKLDNQSYVQNHKILRQPKCSKVQTHIFKDGYSIPFPIYTPHLVTNHLPFNNTISFKKNLFRSMYNYYSKIKRVNPFDYIPITYHIQSPDDQEYTKFIQDNQNKPDKVWIVKPGQKTNRGNGIRLATFSSITSLLVTKLKHQNGEPLTYIVQSYINKPFLYNNRKFDIRHYLLLTSLNNKIKAYWYKQGYIRTSSQPYDLNHLDNTFIHLTNDAIQKESVNYSKYQQANKLSYSQFQRYLDYTHSGKKYQFQRDVLCKIKDVMVDVIKGNYLNIDPERKSSNFQVFGLDFMVDKNFKPWLIQINENPCLQVNCNLLNRIIPSMVQNSLRLALDPLFPPKNHFPISKRFNLSDHYLKNLRYQLIFDQESLTQPIFNDYGFQDVHQEKIYQDQGQEIQQLIL